LFYLIKEAHISQEIQGRVNKEDFSRLEQFKKVVSTSDWTRIDSSIQERLLSQAAVSQCLCDQWIFLCTQSDRLSWMCESALIFRDNS